MISNAFNALGRGRMSRGVFLTLGITLVVFKFLIDHIVAGAVFDRTWGPMNYLIPIDSFSLGSLTSADREFVLTMCWIALPFAVVGLWATSRRLRDSGLSLWWIVLFFVPVVNLVFFMALTFMEPVPSPAAQEPARETPMPANPEPHVIGPSIAYASSALTRPPNVFWSRMFPENAKTSQFRAALVTVPISLICIVLTATVFRNYGLTVFVGLPFCCGLITSVLHGYSKPRTYLQCLSTSTISLLMSGVACICFGVEGLVCLVMAFPITFIFMGVGAALGHSIQSRPIRPAGMPNALWSILLVLPMLMGFESREPARPAVFSVVTRVEVNAPPEVVWRRVVSFPELAAPTEWLFRAGIAYPMRAQIDGIGVGAIRRCEFSSGAFVEPIKVWDEPHLLAFDVTSSPPPMQEWSPYRIRPPHLDNFLVSHGGQFKLTALPNGHTLLEGTTWYEHRMMPETYWRWWSDAIIHRIHLRVLRHVASLAEGDSSQP